MEKLKEYYTTVYSVVHSSCGHYLAGCNSHGEIAIFNLLPFLEDNELFSIEPSLKYPFLKFSAHTGPIYSLVSSKQLLISGGIGEIKAWKWSDLKKKVEKPVWIFNIPQENSYTPHEVNAMLLTKKEEDGILYAGCGDNKIHCIDVQRAKSLFAFEGHTGYVHCLDISSTSQEIVSGSEDGSVRVWDARNNKDTVHIMEPYKHEKTSRAKLGKWIGCVAFDSGDDWLVCGGAPNLCVWHVRAQTPLTSIVKNNVTHSVVKFFEDRIISGGSEPCISHWGLDGTLNVEVPTSASHVFTFDMNSSNAKQILAVAGSSCKIDLCEDPHYKDFSLMFANQ